jgi:magnesium-transporting ATPase (P-type)
VRKEELRNSVGWKQILGLDCLGQHWRLVFEEPHSGAAKFLSVAEVAFEVGNKIPGFRYIHLGSSALDDYGGRVQQGDLQHDTQSVQTIVRNNFIVTTKYTMVNFVPKFTFEFITKPINAYFLFVCVLQTTPSVSSTDGVPTLLATLILIWAVDITLAGLEDYNRRIADKVENFRSYMVLDAKQRAFVPKPCCEIAVGEIVELQDGDQVPTDLMVLHMSNSTLESINSTAESKAQATGIDPVCYVETKGLDGETNLKLKKPVQQVWQKMKAIRTAHEDALPQSHHPVPAAVAAASVLLRLQSDVKCEMPNERVHSFEGTIDVTPADLDEPIVPVAYDSIILRGSTVRSINAGGDNHSGSSLYGLVLFSGHETKVCTPTTHCTCRGTPISAPHLLRPPSPPPTISSAPPSPPPPISRSLFLCPPKVHMSASSGSRRKTSQLEQRLQWLIIFLGFGGCGGLCLVGATYELYMACTSASIVDAWYINIDEPQMPHGAAVFTSGLAWLIFWQQVAVYFQIMYSFVPISLVISIDLTRMFAQSLIALDILMYDEASDTPCELKTLSLVEELGQVTHLFSDKTGTLTDNIMQFRRFSVAGFVYGMRDGHGGSVPKGVDLNPHVNFKDAHGGSVGGGDAGERGCFSVQATLQGQRGQGQRRLLRHFLHMLAVNHAVTTQCALARPQQQHGDEGAANAADLGSGGAQAAAVGAASKRKRPASKVNLTLNMHSHIHTHIHPPHTSTLRRHPTKLRSSTVPTFWVCDFVAEMVGCAQWWRRERTGRKSGEDGTRDNQHQGVGQEE